MYNFLIINVMLKNEKNTSLFIITITKNNIILVNKNNNNKKVLKKNRYIC